MSRPDTALRSSFLRVLLRGSLLGGAVLDLTLAALLVFSTLYPPGAAALAYIAPGAVVYSWLLAPSLAVRGAVQGLACYDHRRYEGAILLTALTLLGNALLGLLAGHEGPATLLGALGGLQLFGWKATRT